MADATAANAQETAANATTQQVTAATASESQDAAGKPTDAEAKLLKEVMSLKKQLKTYESKQSEAEAAALKEQGKFKELADLNAAKAESLAQRAIKAELALHLPGLLKPELLKLVDTTGLKIADDGSIDGIEEAAAAFKAANPEFFRDAAATTAQVPGTPKPGTTAAAAPASFADWQKMQPQQRAEWSSKHPEAFARLCNDLKQSLTK